MIQAWQPPLNRRPFDGFDDKDASRVSVRDFFSVTGALGLHGARGAPGTAAWRHFATDIAAHRPERSQNLKEFRMSRLTGLLAAAGIMMLAASGAPAAGSAPLYHLVTTIPLGGSIKWDYLHFDGPSDRVYVSHGAEVTVVDLATDKVIGQLRPLPGSHGISVDPRTGLVYADSAVNSDVLAFNPKTFKPVASAPVLLDADGINYDPASQQMYVSGGDGEGLTPVSTHGVKAAPKIFLGTSTEFHVADGQGNEYVNLDDASQIVRIDSKTNTVLARWPVAPCVDPKGLTMDRTTRRLFASCGNGLAVVLDADTGKVITSLRIGSGTDAAAFDPVNHRFFASSGDGLLTVVDEKSPDEFVTLGMVKTAPGARTMAVDPANGEVFLVTADVTATTPPAASDPTGHPKYSFAPGSLKLLIFAPG
jgi:DNA-binding beta-propeller fold protein YncE